MNFTPRTIDAVPVYEAELFAEAGVALVDLAVDLLRARNIQLVTLPEGRGQARLLNLLHWQVGAKVEYVDGDGPLADQVVHYALHQLMDDLVGSNSGEAMLLGEAVASASDFYLLGKLIHAGVETEFLLDTVESLGSYYAQYADEADLEEVLRGCGDQPFQVFAAVVRFLYDAVLPLLYNRDPASVAAHLAALQNTPWYPLLHHYNVGNWVLTIRGLHPQPSDDGGDPTAACDRLLADESAFLAAISS